MIPRTSQKSEAVSSSWRTCWKTERLRLQQPDNFGCLDRLLGCGCIATRRLEQFLNVPRRCSGHRQSNDQAAGSLHHCHTPASTPDCTRSSSSSRPGVTERDRTYHGSHWGAIIRSIRTDVKLWSMHVVATHGAELCHFTKWPHADRSGEGNHPWQWYHFWLVSVFEKFNGISAAQSSSLTVTKIKCYNENDTW